METVVGVEVGGERNIEDSEVAKSIATSLPKQIANPVVYKLVRVDGDGRIVPATDDEIMEVVDLLKDKKNDMEIVVDTGQNVGLSIEGISSAKSLLKSQVPEFTSSETDEGKQDSAHQENATSVAKSSDFGDTYQSGSVEESLNPPVQTEGSVIPKKKTKGSVIPKKKTKGSISSSAATCRNLTPDFSKLRGEICLDKLSIRELHETFRAAFGRETTVKDKAWLKRRIAMGLTNSCDVSTTTFLMKDGKIVKLEKEKCTENIDGTSVNNSDAMIRSEHQEVVTVGNSDMEDSQILGKRLRHHDVENESGSEILDHDLKGSKRIRKPTRRYIEELSEVESHERGGRLIASSRSLRHETPKLDVRPIRHVSSDNKTFVTRVDSLAGIQVPCVSRVRRSRPRKDILALMKFHHSILGMDAKLEKNVLVTRSSHPGGGNRDENFNAVPAEQHFEEADEDEQYSDVNKNEPRHKLNPEPGDSSRLNNNVVTVATAKGGIRRKHHRAWTLAEVMKLVDGVARYGAGRWSEIKKLAFASHSYRTSVDLKDKWRNLLKACFAPVTPDKGMNSRKQTSTPIPAPILLRVRELAQMNARSPSNLGSNKIVGYGGGIIHGTRAGYL